MFQELNREDLCVDYVAHIYVLPRAGKYDRVVIQDTLYDGIGCGCTKSSVKRRRAAGSVVSNAETVDIVTLLLLAVAISCSSRHVLAVADL